MRFKAKLAKEQVQTLYSLVGPISKLNTSSSSSSENTLLNNTLGSSKGHIHSGGGGGGGTVCHLDPDHIRLSTRGGGGKNGGDADGIFCCAELDCSVIFLDSRIESAANDAIVFEIDLGHLRTALQSVLSSQKGANTIPSLHNGGSSSSVCEEGMQVNNGGSSSSSSGMVVMKLAKRNGLPCLCLDACGGSVEVHHALPVKVMRVAEMQYHLPPNIAMPDVQLELPLERPIRTVVERLKSISPHVFIEGSMTGELNLRIDGDGASIRTYYTKLVPRFEDCKASSSSQPPHDDNHNHQTKTNPSEATCSIKVDSKKLHTCLQWQSSMAMGRVVSSAVLCMVENEMLVLHVLLNPRSLGFFTYYVPVHFVAPDQF